MILSNEFCIDAPYGQNMCVITCKLEQEHNLDREIQLFLLLWPSEICSLETTCLRSSQASEPSTFR